MSDRRLWFTADRQRFWLIPEGEPLPPGPLRIRTLGLAARDVDDSALQTWETSASDAAAFIDEGLAETLRSATRGLLAAELDPVELLGGSMGEFLTNPDAVRDGLSSVRARVTATLEDAGVPDDAAAKLRERLAAMDDAVRGEDSNLAQSLERLEERIESTLPQVAETLSGLAGSLRASAARLRRGQGETD